MPTTTEHPARGSIGEPGVRPDGDRITGHGVAAPPMPERHDRRAADTGFGAGGTEPTDDTLTGTVRAGAHRARAPADDEPDPSIVQSAIVIGLYRGLVALFLLAIAWGGLDVLVAARPANFGGLGGLGEVAAVAYGAFAVAWLITLRSLRTAPPRRIQRFVYLGTAVDIAAIAVLTMTQGGIASGLGLLLLPPIVATALLSDGRISLFFAALGTLAALAAEFALATWQPHEPASTQAALLGTALFISAVVAWRLAARVGRSEAERFRQGEVLDEYVALNDQIVAHLQVGVVALDSEGRILAINTAAQALLPPRFGRRLVDIDPKLFTWLQFRRHPLDGSETVLPATRDRPEILLRVRQIRTGSQSGGLTLLLIEDTAARRRQAQAQKLAALGRLSASIAHEIRNPLAGISHSAQLLEESPDLADEDRRLIHIIQNHAARVNQIIGNILALSRPGEAHREDLRLKDVIERFSEEFLAVHPAAAARFQWSVLPEDVCVRFAASELHQVLWNLCGNALQHGGPNTSVEIIAGRGLVTPGVTLDVLDDGPGLSPEARQHLFEPFASAPTAPRGAPGDAACHTADTGRGRGSGPTPGSAERRLDPVAAAQTGGRPGHGSGLGLYLCRTLCEHNGARIESVDVPRGTCFRIEFDDGHDAPLKRRPAPSEERRA